MYEQETACFHFPFDIVTKNNDWSMGHNKTDVAQMIHSTRQRKYTVIKFRNFQLSDRISDGNKSTNLKNYAQ